MSRCLITGHKGFIGSRLYSRLQELGHDVEGIDLASGEDINGLQGLVEDQAGRFHPRWVSFKPEYIFHLACWPRIGFSIENPVKTMQNNVLATSNVLNFAKKVGTKRVIYSSSSAVVGGGDGPTNPYGLQKLVSEMECKLYSELYGLDTVCLRYFNVYSPDQKADGPYTTAIANFMEYIRSNKAPFITGTGEQSRDMLHLEDAVSANVFAMNYEQEFDGKSYDVGTGEYISLNEIKNIVLKYLPDTKFRYVQERPGDVLVTEADISPLKEIGWSAKIKADEGIKECFSILRKKIR